MKKQLCNTTTEMDFNSILARLPSIESLRGLNIIDGERIVHHIPAAPGKFGSLRVYHALALQFNAKLDRTCAQQGLALFAEHTLDARRNPGKHPNIDFLFNVIAQDLCYRLEAQYK